MSGTTTQELTPKQRLFVEEFLVDLNATKAAARAGYSPKTARSQGQRLLTNVDIADAIREAMASRSERTGITADMVVEALWSEANDRGEDASHSARVSALKVLLAHLSPPKHPEPVDLPRLVVGLLEHIDRDHYLTPEHVKRLNLTDQGKGNGKSKRGMKR